MKQYFLYHVTAAFLAVAIMSGPAAALSSLADKPHSGSVSIGAEYASGSYGTETTTRSVYLPLIATWLITDRFDAGIEVPFLYQNNSNVTTRLYRNEQATMAAKSTGRGGPGGTGGPGGQPGTASPAGDSTAAVSGLGDIILRLGVIALFESDTAPQLRPSLLVKFPTAKTANGLGTGEFDFGVGVDASKWLGKLHIFGEGSYVWQGKADGFGLKDYCGLTTGIGYQISEKVEPMLLLKGATAPSTYSGDLLEARARLLWKLADSTSLDLFIARGITDSSPDYNGAVAVVYSF